MATMEINLKINEFGSVVKLFLTSRKYNIATRLQKTYYNFLMTTNKLLNYANFAPPPRQYAIFTFFRSIQLIYTR